MARAVGLITASVLWGRWVRAVTQEIWSDRSHSGAGERLPGLEARLSLLAEASATSLLGSVGDASGVECG